MTQIGTVVYFGSGIEFYNTLREHMKINLPEVEIIYESTIIGLMYALNEHDRNKKAVIFIVDDHYKATDDEIDEMEAEFNNRIPMVQNLEGILKGIRACGFDGPVIAVEDSRDKIELLMRNGCTHRADRLVIDYPDLNAPISIRREWQIQHFCDQLREEIAKVVKDHLVTIPQPETRFVTEEQAEVFYALLPSLAPNRHEGESALQYFQRILNQPSSVHHPE